MCIKLTMQTSRIIFEEDLVTTFCSACLCTDRKLFKLLEFSDIFNLICKNVLGVYNTEIFLCFECLALLRNVKKFQEKVQSSQNILKSFMKDGNEKILHSNFSSLSTTAADVLDFSKPADDEVLDDVKLDPAADIKPETEYEELEEGCSLSDNEPLEKSQIASPPDINLNQSEIYTHKDDNEVLDNVKLDQAADNKPETEHEELMEVCSLNDFNVSDNESLEESQVASPPDLNLDQSDIDTIDTHKEDNEVLDNVKLDQAADNKPETEHEELMEVCSLNDFNVSDNESLEQSQVASSPDLNLDQSDIDTIDTHKEDNEVLDDVKLDQAADNKPETEYEELKEVCSLNDFNVSDNESLEESQVASPPDLNLDQSDIDTHKEDNEELDDVKLDQAADNKPETEYEELEEVCSLNDFNISDDEPLSQIACPPDINLNQSEIDTHKEKEILEDASNTSEILNGEVLKGVQDSLQNVVNCVPSGKKVEKWKNKSKPYRSELYKIIDLNDPRVINFYVKVVAIQTEEIKYWLERERNSTYFKELRHKCYTCALSVVRKEKQNHARYHTQRLQYTCDICTMSFANKNILRKHMINHYYIRCCTTCGYKCVSKKHMYSHVRKKHGAEAMQREARSRPSEDLGTVSGFLIKADDKGVFDCRLCSKKCGRRCTLEKHMFSRHSRHLCVICNSTYAQKHGLEAHIRLRHSVERTEETYCVTCDRQFNNQLQFKYHLKTSLAHANERATVKKKQSYPCPACPKVYQKADSLRRHYIRHHAKNKMKHQCADCDKKFICASELREHIKYTHQGYVREKKYMCTVCERGFTSKLGLTLHMRTHTGERPYDCPHCDSNFVTKLALDGHIRTHTGERPYQCPQCDSKFVLKCHLNTHMRTHTGERPYQCPHCDSNFAQYSPFLNHIKRIHNKGKSKSKLPTTKKNL